MGKDMTLHIQPCTKEHIDEHIKIVPSTRIYFGDYPYRVKIAGPGHPHPNYDPNFHWDITDFMRTANLLYKRELHNTAGRNIYFALWDDFIWFVNWMSDYVSEVHAPINEQHILDMHTPGIVLRDKLWHGRFNFRVEFSMMRQRDPVTFNMQEVPMGEREKIFHFIETNFEDYRFSNKDTKWFYNYLYCDQEEWNALEGFANLSFKHSIRLVDKIKLFSEL